MEEKKEKLNKKEKKQKMRDVKKLSIKYNDCLSTLTNILINTSGSCWLKHKTDL